MKKLSNLRSIVLFLGLSLQSCSGGGGGGSSDEPVDQTDGELSFEYTLTGLPSRTNGQAIVVKVDSQTLEKFKYKLGLNVDCKVETGYSEIKLQPNEDQEINIASLTDGTIQVCVLPLIGENSADLSSIEPAGSFILDRTNPTFTLASLPSILGRGYTPGVNTKIKVTQIVSDTAKLQVSLKDSENNLCLNAGKSAFDATCPNYIEQTVSSGVAYFEFLDSLLTEGKKFVLDVKAKDSTGNEQSNSDSFTFAGSVNGTLNFANTYDLFYGLANTSDGGYVTSGRLEKSDAFEFAPGFPVAPGNGSDRMIIAAYDQDHHLKWIKLSEGNTGMDEPLIAVDSQDNIYLADRIETNLTIDGKTATVVGDANIVLGKLNGTNGEVLWLKAWGAANSYQNLNKIMVSPADQVLITGKINNAPVDFGGGNISSVSGGQRTFILKLDSNGNHLASHAFDGANYNQAKDVDMDAEGNVWLAGEFENSITFNSSTYSEGNRNGYLAKLNGTDLSEMAFVMFGGANSDNVHGIAIQNNQVFVNAFLVNASYESISNYYGAIIAKFGLDAAPAGEYTTIGPQDAYMYDIVNCGAGKLCTVVNTDVGFTFTDHTFPSYQSYNWSIALQFDADDGAYANHKFLGMNDTYTNGYVYLNNSEGTLIYRDGVLAVTGYWGGSTNDVYELFGQSFIFNSTEDSSVVIRVAF